MRCDILACYGSTWIDRLIQWGVGERVTHIAIDIGNDMAIETGWFGVKVNDLCDKGGNYYRLRCDTLTEKNKDNIMNFLIHHIGTRYDYKLFIGIAIHRLLGIDTGWNDPTKYICSEVALNAWRSQGYELMPGVEDRKVIPSDLLKSKLLREVMA
jgi:hypothetical protein